MGQSLERLVSPVSSLFYFLAEFPSGAERLATSTYLPWLLSSVREGAQGGAPSTIQVGTSGLMKTVQVPCLGTLLVFHVNQVIPTTLFFPNLSLYS